MKINTRPLVAGAVSGLIFGFLGAIVVAPLSISLAAIGALCCMLGPLVALLQLGLPGVTVVISIMSGFIAGWFSNRLPATRNEVLASGGVAGLFAGLISSLLVVAVNFIPSVLAAAGGPAVASLAANNSITTPIVAVAAAGTGALLILAVIATVAGVIAGILAGAAGGAAGLAVAGWFGGNTAKK